MFFSGSNCSRTVELLTRLKGVQATCQPNCLFAGQTLHDCAPVVALVRACTAYPPCPRTHIIVCWTFADHRRAECAGVRLPSKVRIRCRAQPACSGGHILCNDSRPDAGRSSSATISIEHVGAAGGVLKVCCGWPGHPATSPKAANVTIFAVVHSKRGIAEYSVHLGKHMEMGSCTAKSTDRLDWMLARKRHDMKAKDPSSRRYPVRTTDFLHGSSSIAKAGMDIEEHRYRQGPGRTKDMVWCNTYDGRESPRVRHQVDVSRRLLLPFSSTA